MRKSYQQKKFLELRAKFPYFIFEGFEFQYSSSGLDVVFHFNLSNQFFFNPTLKIPGRSFFIDQPANKKFLTNLIFQIGMVELVSYWKCTCSPSVIIKNHYLTEEQVQWWKKLYFHGLGELFYLNGIETNQKDFMDISSDPGKNDGIFHLSETQGQIIPIGGGKDSVVTLELLSEMPGLIPFIINPRGATLETVYAKGYSRDQVAEAHRTIDPTLLDLNSKGFLNGHTPFSALVAFLAVLTATLSGRKYVVLSNESSANEPTVKGLDVNHQYSKSVEFEADFRSYMKNYVTPDIEYFSFLRPLSELQIARLFSGFPGYFRVFKSCNVGSKKDTWCGKCSKCLFTFIILSPFLDFQTLTGIFGHDLLEDESLRPELDDLTGVSGAKPFDCTGTTKEINIALCHAIKERGIQNLPRLLKDYTSTSLYSNYHTFTMEEQMKFFDRNHFLPASFEQILKSVLHD